MTRERAKVSRIYFMSNEKATYQSFYSMANEYFDASKLILAKYADRNIGPEQFKIIYYLIGHSLELYLKAYFLYTGLSLQDCINIGHDLRELQDKAKQNGFDILNETERHQINELANYYSPEKQLEYEGTDFQLDKPFYYVEILNKLKRELKTQLQ